MQKTIISEDLNEQINGDAVIKVNNIRFNGMVTGNLFIQDAKNIFVDGMVVGDIVVSGNSEVTINGMVNGKVSSEQNSKIIIFGMAGQIEGSNIIIMPKSITRD